MAEPISLLASLIAISNLAANGSVSLYQLAADLKTTKEDIENFALDTAGFSSITGLAHDSLQHNLLQHSSTQVAEFIKAHGVIDHLLTQAQRTSKHMKASFRNLEEMASWLRVIAYMRWKMRKNEIRAIRLEMECYKTSVLCIMFSIGLEVKGGMLQTDEIKEEMYNVPLYPAV